MFLSHTKAKTSRNLVAGTCLSLCLLGGTVTTASAKHSSKPLTERHSLLSKAPGSHTTTKYSTINTNKMQPSSDHPLACEIIQMCANYTNLRTVFDSKFTSIFKVKEVPESVTFSSSSPLTKEFYSKGIKSILNDTSEIQVLYKKQATNKAHEDKLISYKSKLESETAKLQEYIDALAIHEGFTNGNVKG